MADDYFKPRGPLKASKPDTGGGVLRPLPTLGIVKSNIDPQRGGKIFVYLPDLGTGDPNNSKNWVPVNYLSPFYGVTSPSSAETGWGEYVKNPNSYGVWNSPPDIGTTVICLFVDGKPDYGFYIGAIPPVEALHMVPAIGGSENIVANAGEAAGLGGATRLPVVNINSNNSGIADGSNYLNEAKPVHSYVASILAQQGLIRDPIRGVIGTTSQRETPSRVGWGVSTPGRPIYEGGFTDETITDAALSGKQNAGLKVIARRGGHSLVMDDGDILGKDQLVRIRSSLGHQILMSDDGQCLHIIHANGQSWIELGKEGTIDMYSTNSVNVRTQGDLNLHADNNININAGKALNISADTIAISSEKQTTQKVGTDFSLYASGTYTTKVDGKMSFASAADASFYSDAITYFNGSKINLNTGASSLVPQEVKPLPVTAHTDTLNDDTKGWLAAPGKLLSIVSRAPAHAPWASANQGVDVKINNNASAALPAAPSPAVAAANVSAGAPTTPVTAAAASTVPPSSAVSKEMPKNLTGTMMAAVKTITDTGPAAAAAKLGAGVVETAQGPVMAAGAMAQSPAQLEACGFIKPGSAALIENLVQGGKTIQQACTPNLFTGLDGVTNLQAYVNDPTKQVAGAVRGFQGALDGLKLSGTVNGNESGTQLAGLVMSAATVGVNNTLDFVKNSASSVIGTVTGVIGSATKAVNNLLGDPASLIANGNFAGGLADKVTGALGGISTSLEGLKKTAVAGITGLIDNAKGVAAAAFGAITASIPTLKVGVPQNIKDITEKALAAAQLPTPAAVVNPLTGAIGSITSIAQGAVASVTGALGTVDKTLSAATGLIKTALSGGSNLSTGLGLLPGGGGGSSLVNNAISGTVGAINNIPAVAGVKALIGQANLITTGISSLTTINPLASSGVLNAVTDASGALTKGLNILKGGKEGLSQLALKGLPTNVGVQLESLVNSFPTSGSGGYSLQLPTVAINTDVTRPKLDLTTKTLLSNSLIPPPNFAGISEDAYKAGLSKLEQKAQKRKDIQTKIDAKFVEITAAKKEVDSASAAYDEAKNNLPAGSPEIEAAIATAKTATEKLYALRAENYDLINQLSSA